MKKIQRKYSLEDLEKCNIKSFKFWSEEEDNLIKRYYPKLLKQGRQKELVLILKNDNFDRTYKAIQKRASILGVTKSKPIREIKYFFICKECKKETASTVSWKREYCSNCNRLVKGRIYRKTNRGRINHYFQVMNSNSEENKIRIKKYKKIYWQRVKNTEEYKKKRKEYYVKNREQILIYQKKYRENEKKIAKGDKK